MAERCIDRLLMVEDDPNFGRTLIDALGRTGYEVTWVESLRKARRELTDFRFHLALLDIGLSDGSGFTLGAEIRARYPGTSVIFLTSLGNPNLRVHGLELGADDYVAKASSLQELLLRIRNALGKRRHWHAVPERIRVGRASIDFSAMEARVDERTEGLSTREAALLRFLIARQTAVVSRDEILDEVWSRDEYPTPRTVDNFIVRLRRLVEEDPEHPRILQTVWGSGYRLAWHPSETASGSRNMGH